MKKLAIFLDFDDTLVHTEEIKFKSLKKYLQGLGVEKFSRNAGESSSKIIKKIFANDSEEKQKALAENFKSFQADFIKESLENDDKNILFPFTIKLLTFLKNESIDFNIVTTSNRLVLTNVVNLTGLSDFINIDNAITKDDTNGNEKPSPYPYILAAQKMNISPKNCLAIEDSLTGLTAASESGCKTIYIKRNDKFKINDDIKIFRTIKDLNELIDIIQDIRLKSIH